MKLEKIVNLIQIFPDLMSRVVECFSDCLTDVRQNLAAPRPAAKQESTVNLSELLSGVQLTTVEQVKSVLSNLQVR